MMSIDRLIYLKPWMEIRGKLHKISEDDSHIYLSIGNKVIEFRKESDEGSYIKYKLNGDFVGKEIAILKTDIPKKPLIIRVISNPDRREMFN